MHRIIGLILAAGKSSRFKGDTPKFLHPVLGKKILDYVSDAIKPFVYKTLYVVSDQTICPDQNCVIQKTPLGTGHAVMEALPLLEDAEKVLIAFGDTPFIQKSTIQQLCASPFDMTIAVFKTQDLNNPYGRVDPVSKKIIQYKDASAQERINPLCHAGIMIAKSQVLKDLLPKLSNKNATKEYYLTDVINMFTGEIGMIEGTEEEFLGVDNRLDLAMAEHIKNKECIKQHMMNGVTVHMPETVLVHHDTQIAPDAEIGPHVVLGPNVVIESRARILPFCYLENCVIRQDAAIGPFAHVRGHSEICEEAEIGNFVEIKNSQIGPQSKAKHHAYLGDTTVGTQVNIGAGTITCNYNGKTKSQTIIQDNAFIGSNVNLIAPITVGTSAYIGAGSTVSKDIEPDTFVLERATEVRKKRQ